MTCYITCWGLDVNEKQPFFIAWYVKLPEQNPFIIMYKKIKVKKLNAYAFKILLQHNTLYTYYF